MQELTQHDIWTLLLSLGILLTFARVLGELAQRFGQPAVLGEIVAGVLLGPTLLGTVLPEIHAFLFPLEGPRSAVMEGLSSLAITLFLLVVGMEVNLSTVWRQGKTVLYVGFGGMLAPFVLSFAAAWWLPNLLGNGESEATLLVFALFFATAMTISAVPVMSKTLMDLGLYRTDLGMIVIAGGIFNDLAGWILFAVILGMTGVHSGLGLAVGHTIGLTLGFVVFMLTIGRRLIHAVFPWVQAHFTWPGGVLGLVLALSLLSAAFTEAIGVHAALGAFLLGVIIGDSSHLRAHTRKVLSDFISFLFVPLFFAMIGLHINFLANFNLVLVLAVFIVACIGKLLGAGIGARAGGMTRRQSWAVGFAMNARGPIEVIVATLALDNGIIGEQMFEALVLMAVATSVMPGPIMQHLLERKRPLKATDFLSGKTFVPSLHAASRLEAIQELAATAADLAGLSVAALEAAVWRREQAMATSIGDGVAVPHARIEGVDRPVVAVGISPKGLDFDAPDGNLVHLVFMIVTPAQDNGAQLEILADIAHTCMRPGFVERATALAGYIEFLALLRTSGGEASR